MPRIWMYLLPLLFLLLRVAREGEAQAGEVPQFNTIRTPASPAFVLLGVEPTSVARPSTPADFAASLVDASDNFSSLPKDYALEASPYWLVSHPGRSWREDVRRSPWQSVQRTFTLTAATAQTGTDAAPVTGVAVSGRAALLSGHLSQETVSRLQHIDSLLPLDQAELLRRLQAGSDALDVLTAAAMDRAGAGPDVLADNTLIQAGLAAAEDGLEAADESTITKAKEAVGRQLGQAQSGGEVPDAARAASEILAALAETERAAAVDQPAREALAQALEDFVSAREGLFLEVAGGTSWRAPSGAFDSTSLSRWGAWLTASYQLPELSFVAVARYLDAGDAPEDDAIDVGARVVYTRDLYAVSLEYVDRHLIHRSGAVRPWRLAGIVDYKISRAVWLTGSFGRDYASDSPGSLLARLGVSLQLSKERYGPDRSAPTR